MLKNRAVRWCCGTFTFPLETPLVMGILNVTPDSFSDGGEHDSLASALEYAAQMVEEGADIIDVGGESTRPGSEEVPVEEELRRTVEVVRELASRGLCVSIDTRHAPVAQACVDAGAAIVNDVSGFRDPAMRAVVAGSDAGCVVMHMAGEPRTMQEAPAYADVVAEVRDYLLAQAHLLEEAGVATERICLDPGVGFGKTTEHNVALLEATSELATQGYPLMVATSRKRFIGELYGGDEPRERVWGSVATAVRAICAGACVARVHDVKQTIQALSALYMPPHRAMIGLGANLGDRVAAIEGAVSALRMLPATEVYEVSSIYESEPAYNEQQPAFANAVVELQTQLIPHVLLAELHRIENASGRLRLFANAPRTLDLDIIDYSGVVCHTDDLVLPHPRLAERDFVVTPLLEVAPAFTTAEGVQLGRGDIRYGKVTGRLS